MNESSKNYDDVITSLSKKTLRNWKCKSENERSHISNWVTKYYYWGQCCTKGHCVKPLFARLTSMSECPFESWLFCVQFNFLLKCQGMQWKVIPILGFETNTIDKIVPGLNICCIWLSVPFEEWISAHKIPDSVTLSFKRN